MILEQAFQSLPEVLCGSRYPGQDYEGGLVSAFAMAVLQELNGRNAPNPLGCLQGERLYHTDGFGLGRWLRADLVVKTGRLKVGSERLGDHYGWRHENWLECKFFRNRGNGVPPKTQNTAGLAADILRLATLVPESPGVKSRRARYLLHVYDSHPRERVARRRNAHGNVPIGDREWVRQLRKAGPRSLCIDEMHLEPQSFRSITGQFDNLTLAASVTNLAIEPFAINAAGGHKLYWCYLTRFDSVSVGLDGHHFSIDTTRNVEETEGGDLGTIRSAVAARLGQIADAEQTPPDDPSPPEEDDETTEADDVDGQIVDA